VAALNRKSPAAVNVKFGQAINFYRFVLRNLSEF
jgi:hypothetical protein